MMSRLKKEDLKKFLNAFLNRFKKVISRVNRDLFCMKYWLVAANLLINSVLGKRVFPEKNIEQVLGCFVSKNNRFLLKA